MITLYNSNTYTPEDFEFLLNTLDSGYTPCTADTCANCDHKMACADITRLYRYVSDKHNTGAGRRGKRQAG